MEVVFISPGVFSDAGGFILYIGSDGKVHVKRVPPWDPETRAELRAAFSALDHAGAIKNETVAQQFLGAAMHVVQAHAAQLQRSAAQTQSVG